MVEVLGCFHLFSFDAFRGDATLSAVIPAKAGIQYPGGSKI